MSRTSPALTTILTAALFLVLQPLPAPLQAAKAEPAADRTGTLERIAATGRIVLGHRQGARPFSFVDTDGTVRGYSIDLCLAVVEAVKAELQRPDLETVFLPVTADTRFEKLQSGDMDLLCGATTQSLDRQRRMDFSSLTFVTGATLLTGAASPIDTVLDLAGRRVGVIDDTTTAPALAQALERSGIPAWVVNYDDHLAALAALEAGEIDAFAADRVVLIGLLRNADRPELLRLTGGLFSHEPYALAMQINDHRFRTLVNRALSETYSSPAISDIYERWFGTIGARPSELLRALYLLQTFPE